MTIPHLSQRSTLGITDHDWIRKSFYLAQTDIPDNFQLFTTYTTASEKAVDTTLGGHICINAPHQYTPFADPRVSTLSASATDGFGTKCDGLGRFWSEQMDDNMQKIYMSFGRPRFRGIIPFFTNFYDAGAALLAKEGRGSIFFEMGKIGGTVALIAGMVAVPAFGVMFMAGHALKFFMGRPASGFYYLSPTMPVYWERVQYMVNTIAAYQGLVPRRFQGGQLEDFNVKHSTALNPEFIKAAHVAMPDVFLEEGGIDIYNVANKAARLEHLRQEERRKIAESNDQQTPLLQRILAYRGMRLATPKGEGQQENLKRYFESALGSIDKKMYDVVGERLKSSDLASAPPVAPEDGQTTDTNIAQEQESEEDYLSKTKQAMNNDLRAAWVEDNSPPAQVDGENATSSESSGYRYKIQLGFAADEPPAPETTPPADGAPPADAAPEPAPPAPVEQDNAFSRFWDAMWTNAKQGNQWVAFHVAHQGAIGESFSNSYTNSEIDSTLNGTSNTLRSAYFNFSGGKTGFAAIDAATQAVMDFAKGALSGLQLDGLLALAGGANVHIPKRYESSSTNFTTNSYSIELRSPYGNPLAQFINLYVPLAMLLSAALPVSAGAQAYVEPYLVHLYSRGKTHVRMGAISSLSIQRGVGNVGYAQDGRSLGIDVSFDVIELSNQMHAPITSNFSLLKPWNYFFDDDSVFKDYLGTITNLTLSEMTDLFSRMGLNMAIKNMQIDSWFSASHIASLAADNFVVRSIAGLAIATGLTDKISPAKLYG